MWRIYTLTVSCRAISPRLSWKLLSKSKHFTILPHCSFCVKNLYVRSYSQRGGQWWKVEASLLPSQSLDHAHLVATPTVGCEHWGISLQVRHYWRMVLWFCVLSLWTVRAHKMRLVVDVNGDEGKGTHVSVHAYLMRGDNDSELSWPFKGTIHQPAQPAGRWAAPHQGSCGCLNVALLKTPTPRGCVVEIEVHCLPPGKGQFISSNVSKKSSTHLLQWWWEGAIPGRWREYYIQ